MVETDRLTSKDYLVNEQYRDATNLRARMQLHERFSVNERGWHQWVFDQFDVDARGAVLEVGCGPGTLWRTNGERILQGWVITLGDLSPGMVEEAKENLQDLGHSIRIEQLDAQEIPFDDGA